MVAGGGGGFAPGEDMTLAVKLTRLFNLEINDNTAFPYDTAIVLDTSYATWAGTGNPVVIVRTGWYFVWVNSTTLGTGYSSAPDNSDWLHAVGRNGITLDDTIYGERNSSGNGASAQFISGGSPAYLEAGDELEVYYVNFVTGETSILVESNPSVGPNYLTCAGPGTLSPHLMLIAMGGLAP